jgi:hypothetical protein
MTTGAADRIHKPIIKGFRPELSAAARTFHTYPLLHTHYFH